MDAGFSHFERHGGENFASAVLCLLLEVDAHARDRIVDLLQSKLLPEQCPLGPLREVARERGLTTGSGTRRGDLCLRFERGTILVEVKTRSWDVDHVIGQLEAQAASAGPFGWDPPLAVVLLAPTFLANRVRDRIERPVVHWPELIAAVDHEPSPLAARAVRHWRTYVEPTIGIEEDFTPLQLDGAVRRVSCLRAFLEACAFDIGQTPFRRKLDLTGFDGRPFASADGAWRWHGLSVPLRGHGRHRIGIYRYLAAPEGHRNLLEGLWLQLYLEDGDYPEVRIPFGAADLRPATLDSLREEFRSACKQSGLLGTLMDPGDEADEE